MHKSDKHYWVRLLYNKNKKKKFKTNIDYFTQMEFWSVNASLSINFQTNDCYDKQIILTKLILNLADKVNDEIRYNVQ